MSQRRPETGLNWPSLVVPAGLRQLALALLSQTGPRAGSGGCRFTVGFEALWQMLARRKLGSARRRGAFRHASDSAPLIRPFSARAAKHRWCDYCCEHDVRAKHIHASSYGGVIIAEYMYYFGRELSIFGFCRSYCILILPVSGYWSLTRRNA